MYSDLPCSVYTVNGQMRIKRTYTRSIRTDLENIDEVFYLNVLVFNIHFSVFKTNCFESRRFNRRLVVLFLGNQKLYVGF